MADFTRIGTFLTSATAETYWRHRMLTENQNASIETATTEDCTIENMAFDDLNSQIETAANADVSLSDAEIARRVLQIRRGWKLNERIARREEANRRFAQLVESIAA